MVALASDDVWAVGSMFSVAQPRHVPFALHWDGRSWTRVDVPSPTPQGGRLFGVAAFSPTWRYAVGQARASLAGAALERQRLDPGEHPGHGHGLGRAAAGPGTVWAVGQRRQPHTGGRPSPADRNG